MKNFLFYIFLLIGIFVGTQSLASPPSSNYLLVIVSQRNAEIIAEAARRFNQSNPELTIQARTDLQLSEYSEAELSHLFAAAKAIFATGLYGPSVTQLQPYFKGGPGNQLIVNSDHRIINLSRVSNRFLFANNQLVLKKLAKSSPENNFEKWLSDIQKSHPQQKEWIKARAYWQAGGTQNTVNLFYFLFHDLLDKNITPQSPKALATVRWFHEGQYREDFPTLGDAPLIAIIDHAGGSRPADSRVLEQFCQQASRVIQHQCVAAVANWGTAGIETLTSLQAIKHKLTAIIMLQDFVIGAGEGRNKATEVLQTLNVPLIKAIKLRERHRDNYLLSSDGLAQEKVYYQVAMPELQGASQPLVIATSSEPTIDENTGIRSNPIEPYKAGVDSVLSRVKNWNQLKSKKNADKRIAIVYYNHPPGRHNIGADNLDVPASLWHILKALKAEGYNTGDLPKSQEALLDLMQHKGVNLPRDSSALKKMALNINKMATSDYEKWFDTLPATVKQEMEFGPFGLLHEQFLLALKAKSYDIASDMLEHTLEEMHHLLEGLDHPARTRADGLIEQLEACYRNAINSRNSICLSDALKLIDAIRLTGIEGLGGWGKAPGEVMVIDKEILLPGIQFGNIFVGPQPPRGWEINEELLHANLAFPPPHQYLAFYHFLKNEFKADALVHLGRHSTYEFLPRRSVGVAADDYSHIIAGDLPGIYPYIVDGVGEGIQAKRRGLAVMVDHLTPPLKSTPLYDELLQLRQLVESFESHHHGKENKAVSDRLVQQIKEKITSLNLREELAEAMSAELAVMGISFEDVDDELLVHEIGHYLTTLQERFMPLGLHIYGKNWDEKAINMMVESMGPESETQEKQWGALLNASPEGELKGLFAGLNSEFISPGQGNDPIRSPASLPTGRNFFALDSSLIPSRTAWELGKEMAEQARRDNNQDPEKREALVLWASDVVRDEGVMIAFGLDMLGLEPQWNSRGLVTGLKLQSLKNKRVRRDTVFTTSGLFRDLYGKQMQLLNQAALMALDASSEQIIKHYPALTVSLQKTLAPLKNIAKAGNESLSQNQVAAHWIKQTRELLKQGYTANKAGIVASYRVFGDAPGSYGAGINRMAERSGAWEKRSELAKVYLRRLGHSYGIDNFGEPSQKAFEMQLSSVENTYFGRSSNLYGLIDNNDAFDYLGGLSLAVETLSGQEPNNFVIDHSDPQQFKTQSLKLALRQELRGRFLNPEWLQGLMVHGYAGARTMGSEFLEYLWGWQITNPTLVGNWAWEEVKSVYIDDKYQLQLDKFLEDGHNVHVKSNMAAIMLVAIHKEFWQADETTRQQLAEQFAELVIKNGLPGSGHTDPEHPMLPWLEQYLTKESWQALSEIIADAKPEADEDFAIHRISEIDEISQQEPNQKSTYEDGSAVNNQDDSRNSETTNKLTNPWVWLSSLIALFIVSLTIFRAIHQAKQHTSKQSR